MRRTKYGRELEVCFVPPANYTIRLSFSMLSNYGLEYVYYTKSKNCDDPLCSQSATLNMCMYLITAVYIYNCNKYCFVAFLADSRFITIN